MEYSDSFLPTWLLMCDQTRSRYYRGTKLLFIPKTCDIPLLTLFHMISFTYCTCKVCNVPLMLIHLLLTNHKLHTLMSYFLQSFTRLHMATHSVTVTVPPATHAYITLVFPVFTLRHIDSIPLLHLISFSAVCTSFSTGMCAYNILMEDLS